MDKIADIAQQLVMDVRDLDPAQLISDLHRTAIKEPLLAAQLTLALAAMVPDDEPQSVLEARVWATAGTRQELTA